MKRVFAWMCVAAILVLAVCMVSAAVMLCELINQSGLLPYLTATGIVLLAVGSVGFAIARRMRNGNA